MAKRAKFVRPAKAKPVVRRSRANVEAEVDVSRETFLHADKPGTAPAAAPLKIATGPIVKTAFPERSTAFPRAERLEGRVWVNGNAKTAADGVMADMTAAEIAALDNIPANRLVRLDYHRGHGTATLENPTDALRVEDGMCFTAVQR